MRHIIIFLGYNQSRIQHPVYRRFIQASLVGRNTTLLFQSHQLEEREFVHEVNEQQRRAGMPSELGFHICATLDEPMMGQQIIQAITMIRRLYDVPSYVYALLPDLDTCSAIQKKNAWNSLVAINNGINDYPDVQLISHCFLYHDSSQVSLAHFLFDITQESEALDLVERYGYLNKLRRPKTYETAFEMEFPAIFSSFNVSGISYPDDEIRHYIHQSYLNALLGLSRPNVNPISMEQCNEHVSELLTDLPLSEELTDLTGNHFLALNRASGVTWQNVEEYWQQAVERIVQDLQDKPRDEWASQLRNNLEVDYQTRYRNMGVEYFYRQEKKKTPDYCLALLCTLKEKLQKILLNLAYPPETGQDIVRSIINHLQLLTLHFSQRQADKYMEQAKKCPARFLYQALKLMNQCDLGYRQSSNKRLLVELTLIEIAQITQEEDTPAAGRSPRRLKSLFQKLVRSVQQQKTAQQVAAAEPKPLHTARVSAQQNGSKNQDADARPVAPKLKLGNLGMSFANLRKGDGKKPIPETTPLETAENEQQQFTEEEMIAQWVAMCQRMPQQMAGIAARMRNMRPHITDYPHILAVVDNQILLDQMNAIRGRIRSTLALALHNDDITLDLQMAQDNEVTKVLSRKELFEEISTKNPAISKLRGLLDLELA